jgi:hypothetical protein
MTEIRIDVPSRLMHVQGKTFPFSSDEMEVKLIQNRGLPETFRKFGNSVFEELCKKNTAPPTTLADMKLDTLQPERQEVLAW